jgi:hypothetical protein
MLLSKYLKIICPWPFDGQITPSIMINPIYLLPKNKNKNAF